MLDSLAQRARGRRATSEHQQPGDYRFEAMSRMLFFSRLRASASTWSFHRSVFHSAPRGVVVEPDWAGLRPAWPEFTDGESAFRPLLGVALDLDLGMDMAHLRGVGDLSGDRDRDFPIAPDCLSVCERDASSVPHGSGCAYGDHHPFLA